MFVDKKLWEKLKENIDNLYWDEDRMSSDGRYFLKQIDNNIIGLFFQKFTYYLKQIL